MPWQLHEVLWWPRLLVITRTYPQRWYAKIKFFFAWGINEKRMRTCIAGRMRRKANPSVNTQHTILSSKHSHVHVHHYLCFRLNEIWSMQKIVNLKTSTKLVRKWPASFTQEKPFPSAIVFVGNPQPSSCQPNWKKNLGAENPKKGAS